MHSFNELLLLHRELDEMFFEHQRELILGNLSVALERLETYEERLLAHILDEEDLMLPIYGNPVDMPIGGTAEIYLNEHRKIRECLILFKAQFTSLFAAADRERAILFLLDSQTIFKELLVHHDTRERKFLYPLLDQVTDETERQSLFAKLRLRPSSLTSVDTAYSVRAQRI